MIREETKTRKTGQRRTEKTAKKQQSSKMAIHIKPSIITLNVTGLSVPVKT